MQTLLLIPIFPALVCFPNQWIFFLVYFYTWCKLKISYFLSVQLLAKMIALLKINISFQKIFQDLCESDLTLLFMKKQPFKFSRQVFLNLLENE